MVELGVSSTRWLVCIAFALTSILSVAQSKDSDAEESEIEEVIVTARASFEFDRLSQPSTARIELTEIDSTGIVHPNEIMSRIPGAWISRGSGQEHLTAIRSGVLTGAGACGAYLLLENGIPIRPTSFCNVNGLFELNTEQAQAIEVIRGPASSRYGGNALHGAINVITFVGESSDQIGIEGGEYGWNRIQGRTTLGPVGMSAIGSQSEGWRDETGYTHYKFNGQLREQLGDWSAVHTLAYVQLNQETGGYVLGEDAYKDPDLRFSNPNPEAYRDAKALRLATHYSKGDWAISGYGRWSRMDFLMHFLPGQPQEKNDHQSVGSLVRWINRTEARTLELGLQVELFNAELLEIQHGPTVGSAFLVATRPQGTHYDYGVLGGHVGIYHDGHFVINDGLNWGYRIRSEQSRYAYTNYHWDGNTKDDGSACGFGGCLYTRPADRNDHFSDHSLKVSVEQSLTQDWRFHVTAGTSFRPPQLTELYRLQNGQEFADIDSEQLTSIESGFRRVFGAGEVQLSAYTTRNADLVIRDSEGFNQNGGKVKSTGLEWLVRADITPKLNLAVAGTLAHHQYDIDLDISRGGRIVKGNDVDTAPRHLFSVQTGYKPTEKTRVDLDVVRMGEYFLDLANSATYPGHTVANVSVHQKLSKRLNGYLHIRNLFDTQYADRADLAFGNHRYFPAMPRNIRLGFTAPL